MKNQNYTDKILGTELGCPDLSVSNAYWFQEVESKNKSKKKGVKKMKKQLKKLKKENKELKKRLKKCSGSSALQQAALQTAADFIRMSQNR